MGRGVQEEDQEAIASRCASVLQFTRTSVQAVMTLLQGNLIKVAAAGIVVGSMADPAGISNPHIRAHAMEGRLFWKTLEEELTARGVPCLAVRDKDLFARASAALGLDPARLAQRLAQLGNGIRPWRLEQKQAAAAAWITLAE